MADSTTLAPCPFCGVGARHVQSSAGVRGTMGYDQWCAIQCAGCGAGIGFSDRRFREKADGAAAWNRRAIEAAHGTNKGDGT